VQCFKLVLDPYTYIHTHAYTYVRIYTHIYIHNTYMHTLTLIVHIHTHTQIMHTLCVCVCGEPLLNCGHHLPINTESCPRTLEYSNACFWILLSMLTVTNSGNIISTKSVWCYHYERTSALWCWNRCTVARLALHGVISLRRRPECKCTLYSACCCND
jgi:hypothetical protein